VLALLTLITGVGLWFLIPAIANGLTQFGVGILVALAFFVCVGLFMLLGKLTPLWMTTVVFLSGIPFLLHPSRISLVVSLILGLGLTSDRAHAKSSLLKNTSEHWFVPIKTCFGSTLTGMSMMIATIVLLSTTIPSPDISQLIPKSGIRYVLSHFSSATGSSPVDPTMTVRQYIVSQAESGGVPLSSLSPSEQSRIILTSVADFEQKFGVSISPDDTLEDTIHRSTVSVLEKYSAPYAKFFPYISAIALFFTLRFLFIPLRVVAVLLVMAVIRLLIKRGIVRQGARQITIYYPELA